MSYLLDKKLQRKKISIFATFFVFFVVLFYFRVGVFRVLSSTAGVVFRPIFFVGNKIGGGFSNIPAYFSSRSNLEKEIAVLNAKINESNIALLNLNSVAEENIKLKEILNRKDEKKSIVVASILAKPNQSLYDTLVVDAGTKQNIKEGSMVFAFGNVPIGRVVDVGGFSSKIVLFSSSKEKMNVIVSGRENIKDVYMEVVGRGGGNFEMILPRDILLEKGDQVMLPGIRPYIIGIVETIISDPRDAFTKVLLVSPVNIQELNFVEIEN